MGLALTAHRRGTATLALLALLWGGWVWGLVTGLWLAVWIIGLSCLAVGATLHELAVHRHRQGWPSPDPRARAVKLSGFGYLSAGMLAGWFPPVLTVTILTAALGDFLAGHRLARRVTAGDEPPR